MAKKVAVRRRPARKGKPTKRGASRTARERVAAAPQKLAVFHVDAFTARRFHGNPAAVVVLDQPRWLPDETMQAIAAETNLPMTAFIRRKTATGPVGIRWMTPTTEVELCGHATLAAAHVLWNHLGVKGLRIVFDSASGKLPVALSGDTIVLDFPAVSGKPVAVSNAICAALGQAPVECVLGDRLMCVFENRRDVYGLAPDLAKLAALDASGVIVTAPGTGHDFVSRYFAPKLGLNEDWVSGSTHCMLVPYWAHVLGKQSLTAHQTSRRGGELFCHLRGDRVHIGGHAVTISTGTMFI